MPSAPDWRSASDYAYVHELNRREFAWEYLRRNPSYKRDYRGAVHRIESTHIDAFALRWGVRFPFRPAFARRQRPSGLAATA
jgi:predicted nucleic acid-binding protein